MKKWKIITGIFLVFILGGVVGSLGSGFYRQYLFNRLRKDPAERKAFFLKKFTERLDLTEIQQKAFKTVIDQMDQQIQTQLQKNRSEFKKIRDEGYVQMKKALNPEQLDAFEELVQEFRDRHRSKRL